jgi:hypothetical protein
LTEYTVDEVLNGETAWGQTIMVEVPLLTALRAAGLIGKMVQSHIELGEPQNLIDRLQSVVGSLMSHAMEEVDAEDDKVVIRRFVRRLEVFLRAEAG